LAGVIVSANFMINYNLITNHELSLSKFNLINRAFCEVPGGGVSSSCSDYSTLIQDRNGDCGNGSEWEIFQVWWTCIDGNSGSCLNGSDTYSIDCEGHYESSLAWYRDC